MSETTTTPTSTPTPTSTAEEPPEGQAEKHEKLLRFPISKIRTIMKLDPDLNSASQEAVFIVAKATVRESEYFFHSLT